MDRYRNAGTFRPAIHLGEARQAIEVRVGAKQLMRRVHFERANAHLDHAVGFPARIFREGGMDRAERQQPRRLRRRIPDHPFIDLGREPHYVGTDVIDQTHPLDFIDVHLTKQLRRVGGEGFELGSIRLLLPERTLYVRFHHLERLDVDVRVDDRHVRSIPYRALRSRPGRDSVCRLPSSIFTGRRLRRTAARLKG